MLVRFIKKIILLGLFTAILASLILVYQLVRFQSQTLHFNPDSQTFLIKPGSSIKTVAQELSLKNIIDAPWLFIYIAKLKGLDTRIRAGEYQLFSGQSPLQLLDTFTRGLSIQYTFTIIEGWTFRQLLHALAQDPIIQNTLQNKSDKTIMNILGYTGQHPEGLFFPETYRFPRGTTDVSFLRRAYRLMQKHLQAEWQNRADNLPLQSSYEALILASIVEKETGAAFERPLIAGVFIQRLRQGMRLQTDPTIIYGMGDAFDGNIRYRDIRRDTPYNTYTRRGLTPTPIALPGLDSIKAVLQPAHTKALYFVAKGDGTHQFSETLEQHNRAVRRYQLP